MMMMMGLNPGALWDDDDDGVLNPGALWDDDDDGV